MTDHSSIAILLNVLVYVILYTNVCYNCAVSRGVARIFQRGDRGRVTLCQSEVTHQTVKVTSIHVPVLYPGCFSLKKASKRGVTVTPGPS